MYLKFIYFCVLNDTFVSHYTCICSEVGSSLKIVIIQNELFRYYRYLLGPFFTIFAQKHTCYQWFLKFCFRKQYQLRRTTNWNWKIIQSSELSVVKGSVKFTNKLLICYFSSWSYCTLPRPHLNNKNTESNNNEVPEINCVQTVC